MAIADLHEGRLAAVVESIGEAGGDVKALFGVNVLHPGDLFSLRASRST
ncbi:hypothetical protein [Burkholderia plantarii]|nr:hypothetical protein [Burkholderia plantarii]